MDVMTPADPLHRDGPDGPACVALAGDWHGNLRWALSMVGRAHLDGARTVLQLGDFGFWRDEPATRRYLSRLSVALAERDMVLFWVDGNHEDHRRLDALPIDARGLRPVADRIWHLPRGFRWQWHGGTWMALGGAHSVDRSYRIPGTSWWAREVLSEQELAYATRPGPVDVMVCHDAPLRADIPPVRGPSQWPAEDLHRSAAHRGLIQHVVDSVGPTALFHGHYHCRYDHLVDGRLRVVGLAEDGTSFADNVLVLNAVERPHSDGAPGIP